MMEDKPMKSQKRNKSALKSRREVALKNLGLQKTSYENMIASVYPKLIMDEQVKMARFTSERDLPKHANCQAQIDKLLEGIVRAKQQIVRIDKESAILIERLK
jgi:hypothetical protein